MSDPLLSLRGVRVHNLRGIDVDIPKRKLTVLTGPSGSGKSSLAFDTIYAEGQRRFIESMSVYARQFLGQVQRPDLDDMSGLSPTVAVEQKAVSTNPRSTVGTVTEIYDHLRILWARLGKPWCPNCDAPVNVGSEDAILNDVLRRPAGSRVQILAPLVRNRRGEFKELFEQLRRSGFAHVRVDGELLGLDSVDKLKKSYRHDIDLVVDRIRIGKTPQQRVSDAVKAALRQAEGQIVILDEEDGEWVETLRSIHSSCSSCGFSVPKLSHQSFSYNSPVGQCRTCLGIGRVKVIDPEKLVTNPERSIRDGAIPLIERSGNKTERDIAALILSLSEELKIPTDQPWGQLLAAAKTAKALPSEASDGQILPTEFSWEGDHLTHRLAAEIQSRFDKSRSAKYRESLTDFQSERDCHACHGERLNPASAAVRFRGVTLGQLGHMDLEEALEVVQTWELEGREAKIGSDIVARVEERLWFLGQVGLGYLTLLRGAPTLSGGEAQRVRLAGQLGSELSGVTYVLDEPSIGLHQRDNHALIRALKGLRDRGNTVLVVEHDEDTIRAADWVVDFGPGAGSRGGEILYAGALKGLLEIDESVTADFLAARKSIEIPERRPVNCDTDWLELDSVKINNINGVDFKVPRGVMVGVSGVSGAGKSTFIHEALLPLVRAKLRGDTELPPIASAIRGVEGIDKVIEIDQRPIGRTPRSNPATYSKVFDEIRALFAIQTESKMFGFTQSRFSFNVAGGRCEACNGNGQIRLEMSFMADAWIPCDTCRGKRFNDATLRVMLRGHSIADVLALPIDDAYELFEPYPKARRILGTLVDVGLGYLTLGQPSTTLSGGEAQRLKLSRELAKRDTGGTLYVLDEPSTGLHFEDIQRLLSVLQRLVDRGNTVIVVEHNLDILKSMDHLIDIGPEGGRRGGRVVAQGTPEDVASVSDSFTGQFLKPMLSPRKNGQK